MISQANGCWRRRRCFRTSLYTKLILLRKTERRPAAREAYVTASHLNEDHFAPDSWKELQAAYKGIEFIPRQKRKPEWSMWLRTTLQNTYRLSRIRCIYCVPMKRITVLLVEDHTIVRQGLRMLIEVEGDIEIIVRPKPDEKGCRWPTNFFPMSS